MKKVYRVKGHDLEELEYKSGMDIANGDVYGFDDPVAKIIWIWVGSKSSVEESTVAAWFVNKIDQERGGVPQVMTIEEGAEPMLFRENWTVNVIEDDTPGFLKKADLDLVEFKLFRVYTEVETEMHDETKHEEVKITRKSLKSGDVFVLDGNDVIYCWIGKGSNLEEKISGQKLMQTIDANRNYTPLQYTIYEGDNDNWEEDFYELIDKIEQMDPTERKVVSVEDQRELRYVAEEAKTAEQHKADIERNYTTTDPDKVPDRIIQAGTDEHKKMVSGSAVNIDELPKEGTVAARLAAINSRVNEEGGENKVSNPPQTRKIPDVQRSNMGIRPESSNNTGITSSSTEKEKKPKTISSEEQDVSKTYGGAPTPEVTELEGGTVNKNLDLSKVKNDCVAIKMHYTVWSVNKACSVCGMRSEDCPRHLSHDSKIRGGLKCEICFASN